MTSPLDPNREPAATETALEPDSDPPLPYRIALRMAAVIPSGVQRIIRRGPIGAALRWVLDVVAPAGRYKTMTVRSGLLQGAVMNLDVRKQRDMVVGSYESDIQQTLARHLQPGDKVFDVGAHLGFFTLLMSRLVGHEGQVVSVEPDPFMGPRLQENVRINNATNVTVVKAAVGAAVLERRFSAGQGGGIGHIADDGDVVVEGTTVDQLSERFGTPDLVKIDVEGGELEVLEGAREVLSQKKPSLIVELHSDQIRQRAMQLLEQHEYEITFIEDDPTQRRHLIARRKPERT